MLKKTMLWSVALLTGTLLLLVGRTEGVIETQQNFCFSKLALQIGKWTPRSNDLGYSMKHAVLTNSAEGKQKTTEVALMLEGLGGLAGAYLIGYFGGLHVAAVMQYVVLSHFGLEPEAAGIYSYYFGYCPMVVIGATTGTSLVGLFFRPRGSFSGALIGAALGVAAATLGQLWCNLSFWYLFPCASAGAVLGYNL